MARPEWKAAQDPHARPEEPQGRGERSSSTSSTMPGATTGGFVPFTLEEFMSVADGLKYVMPEDGGFMVELDGEPQAFGIVLPNLHEILSRPTTAAVPARPSEDRLARTQAQLQVGRLILFGVRKALQRKAVGGRRDPRLHRGIAPARPQFHAIEHIEFGWVLEEQRGMRRPIELSGAEVDKVHRVYEKQLAA